MQFFDPKQEADAKRRRRLAEAMMKAGEQPTSTEVISGVAVKRSPLESLARMGSTLMGRYQENKANEAEAEAAKRRQEMIAQAVQQFGTDPQAAANMLAQDPSTSDAALKYQIESQNTARNQDFQRQMQQMTLDALAPQRQMQLTSGQLDIEKGRYDLDQSKRNNAIKEQLMQQLLGGSTTPQSSVTPNDITGAVQGMQGVNAPSATTQNMPASPEQMRKAIAQMAMIDPSAANQMRQALMPSTGSTPAAIMIANEVQAALDAGDTDRANLLMQVQKSVDRGVNPYGQNGAGASTMPGYGGAVADIAQQRKQAEATGTEIGKELGAAGATLTDINANMPKLEDVVSQLDQLAGKATYTMAGRAYNEAMRQAGMPVPEGAVARAEYQSVIDNNILPLLRVTFGAAFTQKEGESLKATLGDANMSPEEKQAVLRSFISQKKAQQEALRRQVGENVPTATPAQPNARRRFNPVTGELE